MDESMLLPPRDLIAEQGYLFLGSRLKRLAEQMQSDVSRATQRAGIAVYPGQFPLLVMLFEQGPQTVGALASALSLSQPVTTRNIANLGDAGLVHVAQSTTDGRSKLISITHAGAQAIKRAKATVLPHVEAAVKQVVAGRSASLLDQIAEIEAALAERSLSDRASHIAAQELSRAEESDIPAIVEMMNLAYRGENTTSSWTTEAAYITGDRTSEALLLEEWRAKPTASLLTWRDGISNTLQGSVWLEPLFDETWYLGSLTVHPEKQNGGLGQTLLYCAEQWAHTQGAKRIQLTVVNVRDTLIDWYRRRGYEDTGRTEPFPYGDDRFGTPLRDDLCFVVLEKPLIA
jgi:DNA-binding MarR family transcriptional regulator